MRESLDKRIEKTFHVVNVYELLKKERLPLLIYGTGNLAEAIMRKLKEYRIFVDGCFTDWGGGTFHEYCIMSLDQVRKKYDKKKCNIILAFAAAYRKKELLEEEDVFSNIFEIANPYDHHKHFDKSFVETNYDQLLEVYHLLSDDISRDCFCAFINARITENARYVKEVSVEDIDEFNNDVMYTAQDEVFLDIGAYNGGSINRFLHSCEGMYKKIIAIEPEERNFSLLQNFVERKGIRDVELHKIGCWFEKDRLAFNNQDDKCCRIDVNSTSYIEVDTIDNICNKNKQITMINMGISTAEVEILKGARSVIRVNLPKLIVFMGAAKEELFLIPNTIKEIYGEYRLYLRFQSSMPSRLFLYALPYEKSFRSPLAPVISGNAPKCGEIENMQKRSNK